MSEVISRGLRVRKRITATEFRKSSRDSRPVRSVRGFPKEKKKNDPTTSRTRAHRRHNTHERCVYGKLISLFYSMQRDMMHYKQPDIG